MKARLRLHCKPAIRPPYSAYCSTPPPHCGPDQEKTQLFLLENLPANQQVKQGENRLQTKQPSQTDRNALQSRQALCRDDSGDKAKRFDKRIRSSVFLRRLFWRAGGEPDAVLPQERTGTHRPFAPNT